MSQIKLDNVSDAEQCRHEWIADASSLIAVALLFGTIWAINHFHHVTLDWMTGHSILVNILAYAVLLLDVVLIVSLLCFGPNCHANNKSCFSTFKGRKR